VVSGEPYHQQRVEHGGRAGPIRSLGVELSRAVTAGRDGGSPALDDRILAPAYYGRGQKYRLKE
jgi:hypothetical protein